MAGLKLPRLASNVTIVDGKGQPTGAFIQWWQQVVTLIERSIALIVDLTGIQEQFEAALAAAQQATADAQAAAEAAQTAADNAQAQTEAVSREAALQSSYIDPSSVLTASTGTILVAAHTRYYSDGTSVSVSAGSVASTAVGDVDYVYYSDPTRSGGAVTYIVTTTAPTQTGDTHVVGAVTIPATGSQSGGRGPARPGEVLP